MQSLNKKGFSSVIQISLLILLSVSAIFTLWSYVKDFTGDFEKTLSPAVDCFIQNSEVRSACVNADGTVEVNFNIALDEKIYDTSFRLDQEYFSCGKYLCESCTFEDIEGKRIIYLEPKNTASAGNSLIVNINNCAPKEVILSSCA
ncbi:hypothetical protein J4423_00925 [Candidatus Pacearchaeota archaeon]|nr:hypothetical protein [Candidatus Pacearchaeota archaeon]